MHAYASAWHRPGEELEASGTGEPSTHASKPSVCDRLGEGSEASGAAEAAASWSYSHVWHRLGEGREVSRTGEATMHCSVTPAWRRPGGDPRALVESGEAAVHRDFSNLPINFHAK